MSRATFGCFALLSMPSAKLSFKVVCDYCKRCSFDFPATNRTFRHWNAIVEMWFLFFTITFLAPSSTASQRLRGFFFFLVGWGGGTSATRPKRDAPPPASRRRCQPWKRLSLSLSFTESLLMTRAFVPPVVPSIAVRWQVRTVSRPVVEQRQPWKLDSNY